MSIRLIFTAFLACVLASGCMTGPKMGLPLASPETVTAATVSAPDTTRGRTAEGVLHLGLAWPKRTYQVATLPAGTNAVSVTISDASGSTVFQRAYTRSGRYDDLLDVSIPLAPANNLSLILQAYQEASPSLGVSTPIAQGSGVFNIAPGRTSTLRLPLEPPIFPAITGLSSNAVQAYDTLHLYGSNFGSASDSVSITFNGATATPTLLSDHEMLVTVPDVARTGRIKVLVNGLETTSNVVLWVLDPFSVYLGWPKATWDPSPSSSRVVLYGAKLVPIVNYQWRFASGEGLSSYDVPPGPVTILANPSAGAVATDGSFVAGTTYARSALSIRLATRQSTPIQVVVEGLSNNVSLLTSPAAASTAGLKGLESFKLTAYQSLTDGSYVNSVVFSSSDPASLSIGTDGTVTVLDHSSNGLVTLSAVSTLSSSASASTTVSLSNYRLATEGIAASLYYPSAIAVDANGNQYVFASGTVYKRSPNGIAVSVCADSRVPLDSWGLCVDASGDIYVSDMDRNRIVKILPDRSLVVLAGSASGTGGYADGAGSVALFNSPKGLALDPSGNLYVADTGNHCIRLVSPSGQVSTIAGSSSTVGSTDGKGTAASFSVPSALCVGTSGNLFVLDGSNIRRISADTTVTTAASFPGHQPICLTVDSHDDVFVGAEGYLLKVTNAGTVVSLNGSIASNGTLTIKAEGIVDGPMALALFGQINAICADANDNLFTAEIYLSGSNAYLRTLH